MPRQPRHRDEMLQLVRPISGGADGAGRLKLTVRLGLEDLDYRVRDLSAAGFEISPLRPLAQGSLVHVSFQVPQGLSISVRAIARRWQGSSGRQWFDFTDVDREVINLLLLATEGAGVH